MRNLIEYPITTDEIIACLHCLADEIEKRDLLDEDCGSLQSLMLRSAALTIEHIITNGIGKIRTPYSELTETAAETD